MKYKRLLFSSIFTLGFSFGYLIPAFCQNTSLQIDDSTPIEEIVKSLAGPSVEITNIVVSGDFTKKPAGSFNDVLGLLDIQSGLIMTSGSAKLAIGPNNKPNAGAGNGTSQNNDTDFDLESIVPGEKLYDLITVEFDIHVTNTILSFNYIFGSEEYPEYERQYNDVFGFFISGPGINGVKNLATINGTTPVSVKSINSVKNTSYFVSNGAGSNPAHDFYLQYDGYTKKLTATTEVIPCQTYHIKLAIADARDDILDSGVFIEKGSFTSTSKLEVDVTFEHDTFDYAVEGCNKGYFIIKKDLDWINVADSVTLEYVLTGLADNGTDYNPTINDQPLNGNTITIPANEESVTMQIDALPDAISENPENVHLDIILHCGLGIIATASADMLIKDEIDFPINSIVCKDVLMPINTDASDRFIFTWANDSSLVFSVDCPTPNCSSPSVNLSNDQAFAVHVKDSQSSCETDTKAQVAIQTLEAKFNYTRNINYASGDVFFHNLSKNAETYEWDFGDGQTSDAFEPTHHYTVDETLDSITYKIKLEVTSLQSFCKDEYDTTIVIKPFFIPNVITPDGDPLNQYFVVKGIEPGVWHIKIYNRWGGLVFSSDGYKNDWEGNDVSAGVYYFKLTNPPGDREFKGWIQVIK